MLLVALALTGIPVAAALVSGLAAAWRNPGTRLTSGLQHFAAGVLFAATAIELIPAVLRRSPLVAIVGFGTGVVVMFGFRKLGEIVSSRRDARGAVGLPVGLIVATGIDFLIDGVILGAGFAAGSSVGVLLTVALAVEYLFVGLSLSASLTGSASRPMVALMPFALSLLAVVGTGIGVLTLGAATPTLLAGALAFGAVAFMYLATEELLVEAHEGGETAIGGAGFFVGFLVYLILTELFR